MDTNLETVRAALGATAERWMALAQSLPVEILTQPPADLQRKARHAELGPVTLDQMVNEWVAHDLNHTMQAEQAVMQPFIRASGPWQIFFTNHLMEG